MMQDVLQISGAYANGSTPHGVAFIKRTATLTLGAPRTPEHDGYTLPEDSSYPGGQVTVWLNPPDRLISRYGQDAAEMTVASFLAQVIHEWNLLGADGQPLSITEETIRDLPGDVVADIHEFYWAARRLPFAKRKPSADTSPSTTIAASRPDSGGGSGPPAPSPSPSTTSEPSTDSG
jgi:hypothetical protein